VTASGPGIEKYCIEVDTPLEFTVDTRSAGVAPLAVAITDVDQQPLDVAVKDNQDGTFLCRYVPKKSIKHVVVVTFGGVVIPNFPVRVSSSFLLSPWTAETRSGHFFLDIFPADVFPRTFPLPDSSTSFFQDISFPSVRQSTIEGDLPRSTLGRRAFFVAGPMAWNALPDDLRDPSLSAHNFRKTLTTHLFRNALGHLAH